MRPKDSVKEFGYLTPDAIPEERLCRSFSIPNDTAWLGVFMGALAPLLTEEAWRKFGDLTPEECAAQWQEIFFSFQGACDVNTVDTPYWDTDTDVDDELPDDEQPWYGYVEDATVAPTGLTFIEDAFIWAFTGLIAVSLGGIPGIAPALAFRTISSKFVLSYKNGGDIGTVIRFFVDGVKIYQGTDLGDGTITDVTVLADPEMEDHQIYITSEAA